MAEIVRTFVESLVDPFMIGTKQTKKGRGDEPGDGHGGREVRVDADEDAGRDRPHVVAKGRLGRDDRPHAIT